MDVELNQLNVSSFALEIQQIPIIKYTCQTMTFPGISLPAVDQDTPFVVAPSPGDHIENEELSFSFIVDEKMRNYLALRYWIRMLGFPETYEQFKSIIQGNSANPDFQPFFRDSKLNQFSDVTVTLLSNHKNPIFRARFLDCVPVNLSGLDLSVTNPTTEPVIATASLRFTDMLLEPV